MRYFRPPGGRPRRPLRDRPDQAGWRQDPRRYHRPLDRARGEPVAEHDFLPRSARKSTPIQPVPNSPRLRSSRRHLPQGSKNSFKSFLESYEETLSGQGHRHSNDPQPRHSLRNRRLTNDFRTNRGSHARTWTYPPDPNADFVATRKLLFLGPSQANVSRRFAVRYHGTGALAKPIRHFRQPPPSPSPVLILILILTALPIVFSLLGQFAGARW